jgi:hypothetical protein
MEAGGAIYVTLGASVAVTDCSFIANTVLNVAADPSQRGGAISVDGGNSYAVILRSRFHHNGRPDQVDPAQCQWLSCNHLHFDFGWVVVYHSPPQANLFISELNSRL